MRARTALAALLFISPLSLAPGAPDQADWTVESNQAGAGFGTSAALAGDVNGDGYGDIVVGAPYYDAGQTDEGQLFAYYGTASGLPSTPSWTAESNVAGAHLGLSVAAAGDVNGDGFDDLIAGAPGSAKVYAYYGSASGLSQTANWIEAGPGGNFGFSVSGAGDVNGDGYDDVIIGYPSDSFGIGSAYAYYGSAAGLLTVASWSAIGDVFCSENQFGYAVGGAGDVNGDGYSDVLSGAPWEDPSCKFMNGAAYGYYGSPSGLSFSANWDSQSGFSPDGERFGWSLGSAGDVNADGYDDIIAGSPASAEARAFYGSRLGLREPPSWTMTAASLFGTSVGTAGDFNADGYDDVVIGAPDGNGAVDVYFGSAGGLGLSAGWAVTGDQPGADFGASVGTAGDVDRDGRADVIVGAPAYDNGQTDEGRVSVFYAPAGSGPTMHVARIDPGYVQSPIPGLYLVGAGVTIQDQDGLPVPFAAVSLQLTLPNGARLARTATTNFGGRALVVSPTPFTGTYVFTVLNVSQPAYTYDPGQNVETSDRVTIR